MLDEIKYLMAVYNKLVAFQQKIKAKYKEAFEIGS